MVLLVFAAFPVFAEGEVFPFTGVVSADKVNIRAGQSQNFEALGVLKKGEEVAVVQQSFSWYKIKLPDHAKCYVHRKLVHFLRDQVGEISGNRVNIRARPDTGSAVIGQLNKLTKVELAETLDDWYRIKPVEGVYGWVLAEFIAFKSKDIFPAQVVQLPTRNIYVLKREEELRQKAEEEKRRQEEEAQKVSLKGTIVLAEGQSPDTNIRHRITGDDGQIYYLKGYRSVLDGFLNHRVAIEGLPQEGAGLSYPVLLVTKVTLVL